VASAGQLVADSGATAAEFHRFPFSPSAFLLKRSAPGRRSLFDSEAMIVAIYSDSQRRDSRRKNSLEVRYPCNENGGAVMRRRFFLFSPGEKLELLDFDA
jgi:hypothetical protein